MQDEAENLELEMECHDVTALRIWAKVVKSMANEMHIVLQKIRKTKGGPVRLCTRIPDLHS